MLQFLSHLRIVIKKITEHLREAGSGSELVLQIASIGCCCFTASDMMSPADVLHMLCFDFHHSLFIRSLISTGLVCFAGALDKARSVDGNGVLRVIPWNENMIRSISATWWTIFCFMILQL